MTDSAPKSLSASHLLTLYQISLLMNSSLEFDEALDNVMDAVMEVTKAQRGFLMIADEDTNALQILVARSIDNQTLQEEGYSTTIVNEVVRTREPLLTNNAQFDTRFQPGQSIIMRGLRAILCSPMVANDRLIGVVYVDTAMRSGSFTEADRDLLKLVGGQAGRAIENARLYRVAVEKGRLEKELHMASEIQRGLLPHKMPDAEGYDVVAHWVAAREVAGDFYDLFSLDDGTFGTVIADVSDKGAPAALFMAVARTLLRSYAFAGMNAVDNVRRTNDLLVEDSRSGMFVTVYYSLFASGGDSIHVNAGHNPPLLYRRANNACEYLPLGGRALGWFADNPVQAVELKMEPGDIIVYYTDGLTEAENPQKDYYGEERLAEAVMRVADKTAEEIRDFILKDVTRFCAGEALFDDLTMVVVRYTG